MKSHNDYEPRILAGELTRIFNLLPEGERLNRLTAKSRVDFIGITLWIEQRGYQYAMSRVDNYTCLWDLRWEDAGLFAGPLVHLTTVDYETYLADMTILRMI
jgi:hypothetical protein